MILPACHYGRDALVGIALVLALRSQLSDTEWDERLLAAPLVMHKRTLRWNGNFAAVKEKLGAAFPDASEVWTGDGIRFRWSDRWLHIRSSNTEPILRLIAESPTADATVDLLDRAETLLRGYAD